MFSFISEPKTTRRKKPREKNAALLLNQTCQTKETPHNKGDGAIQHSHQYKMYHKYCPGERFKAKHLSRPIR